ncbi:putative oxidoreductase GLYR1 homolog [Trichonephila clavipes]|nr:putative oxidoreductase GLYR1 homolog [Trichonephila clavipes]
MSEASFKVGDLVWVKTKNNPHWPAKISQPPKEEKSEKIKDKPFKEVTKASSQVVENLEEKVSMVDKQLMEEEQSPIKKRHSYKDIATTLKGKQPPIKEPSEEKQPPVKEKQPSLKEPVEEEEPPLKEKQPLKEPEKQRSSKEPEKEKQSQVEENHPSSNEPEKEKQPPVEENQPFSKEPRKRETTSSRGTATFFQGARKRETTSCRGKAAFFEGAGERETISCRGKASFFKGARKRETTSCRGKAAFFQGARKRETTSCRGKASFFKGARKEKQPPVEENQPSSSRARKEKQPPVEEKQSSSKEPEKEKEPHLEEKQPFLKEPEKEKQPPVEEKKFSLKKRVKNNHLLVEEMKLPVKKQRIDKKQPPIKENQTSINTNPVKGKRKQLEQIASTGKVSKKAEKAGDSVKSPRLVERKRSFSKVSVIGETSMSGFIPCSSKIQKIDEDDSLRSSHNGLSSDLSNPKDLKSDDEDVVSEVSSISSSHWHSGLLCRLFNTKNDDGSVSSPSSRQSPRCEIVCLRKDEPKFQKPDSPTVPTKKKIGFLGLGKMGQMIVRNLLISGHTVFVWNRTKDKCKEFVEAGAKPCENPAEGFVEMSTIGYKSSQENAIDINDRGGRYLEACMTGTKTSANLGTLFILASGDPYVFRECVSCFHAIAENTYFVSTTIAISSMLSNTLSMCIGTSYAVLSEVTTLANLFNVNMDVLELLQMRGIAAAPLLEKETNMINDEHFNVEHSLRNQQKDMDLCLKLSDNHFQPQYLAAAANEVYKQAKMLGYGDLDVSAVFEAMKR